MELSFRIISSPGEHDRTLRDFFVANDNDFYPPIAARKELTAFVQSVYDESGQYLVCYDNDRIVGLTTILANHPNFLYYYQYIAIDKDYRHKGIGNRLYNMVTQICEEQRALRAIVKTWSLNKISQVLFRKHGFYHGETIEDHRDKGVHSYFFFKSFSRHWFQQSVKCLCVAGSGVTAVNFTKMLYAITKDTPDEKGQLSFIVISDPSLPKEDGRIKQFIADVVPRMASHLIFTDLSIYRSSGFGEITNGIEAPDMLRITLENIAAENKKWLLAGAGKDMLHDTYNITGITLPTETQQARMNEIIEEIAIGFISPGYYKQEFADMALINGCNGILLGSPELHTMFGFDRQFDGVEIFDPLLELIFVIQNNRLGDGKIVLEI